MNNILNNLAISMPGVGELVLIFLIVLVLFGASRIPEIARSFGKGITEFKKALGGQDEEKDKGQESKGKS